ncbi:MAG: tryptophan--tRNA ligase, partial [Thermoproteota archaeon]
LQGKMSASNPRSAVYLTDDDKTVKEKIMKYAFSGGQATVELHRKLGGDPSIDVSFQWLYSFFEEDDERIKKLEEDYRAGKLLSGEMKEILIEKLIKFLEKHREKREEAKEIIHLFMKEGELAKIMWSTKF